MQAGKGREGGLLDLGVRGGGRGGRVWARARQTAGINFIRCHLRMPCLTQHMLARGTKAGRGSFLGSGKLCELCRWALGRALATCAHVAGVIKRLETRQQAIVSTCLAAMCMLLHASQKGAKRRKTRPCQRQQRALSFLWLAVEGKQCLALWIGHRTATLTKTNTRTHASG